ncbi:MAG: hypothetical protein ABS49_08015 [Erythrobacter sp. SCN 62-14]|nr:MAG: hypothetical protein ABS49_08015 [Erythrobacter sp. SCN 62-14]
MNDWSQGQLISLVALVGWLIVVASGFASFRLGERQVVRMSLIWLGIFLGAFVIVTWFME